MRPQPITGNKPRQHVENPQMRLKRRHNHNPSGRRSRQRDIHLRVAKEGLRERVRDEIDELGPGAPWYSRHRVRVRDQDAVERVLAHLPRLERARRLGDHLLHERGRAILGQGRSRQWQHQARSERQCRQGGRGCHC